MGQRIDSSLDFATEATPGAPAAGYLSLYAKSDTNLYTEDSSGNERMVLRSGTAAASTLGLSDGAVGTPSLFFLSETNTGLYRVGTHDMALTVNGSATLRVSRAFNNPSTGLNGSAPSQTASLTASPTVGDSGAGTLPAQQFAMSFQPTFAPTSEVGNTFFGLFQRTIASDANATGNLTSSAYGVYASVRPDLRGLKTLANVEALHAEVGTSSAAAPSGAVSSAFGLRIAPAAWDQAVTTHYGIRIGAPTVGTPTGGVLGTVGTVYGLYIEAMSVLSSGGIAWAIFSQGGNSSHAGNLRLGDNTNPSTFTLDVNGTGRFFSTLLVDPTTGTTAAALQLTARSAGTALQSSVTTTTGGILQLAALNGMTLQIGNPTPATVVGMTTTLVAVNASAMLDLTTAGGTAPAGYFAANNTGDKIMLYASGSTGYGFGLQTSRLVAYVPAASGFSVRAASAAGNASSGADVFYVTGTGTIWTADVPGSRKNLALGRPSRGVPANGSSTASGSYSNGTISGAATYDADGNFSGGFWVAPTGCSYVLVNATCGWAGSALVSVRLELWDNTTAAMVESTTDLVQPTVLGSAGVSATFFCNVTAGHSYYFRLHVVAGGPITPWVGDWDFVQFMAIA